MLLQAENLYLRSAIEHKRIKIEELIDKAREERNGIDQDKELNYNNNAIETQFSRKTARYISYKKIGQDNVRYIKTELSRLYEGVGDSIADGIAIEKGSIVYIIDSAKDNGEIRFGIKTIKTISNDDLRAEYVRRINNESVSKGYISDGLSSRFEDKHDNYRRSNRGQEFGEELSVDKRQSSYNKERVSGENGDRGNRRLKYSLKDSLGNELSAEQAEFFKDSKVRDDNGNLLVVYHGTNNEFYTFDKTKIKIDNLGRGFYLVDKKSIAESYARRRTQERGGKEKVLAAYINAKKPFNTDNITKKEAIKYLEYDYLKTHKDGQREEARQYALELVEDEDIINVKGVPDYSLLFSTNEENFQLWLKEEGYDSIIISGEDKRTKETGVAYVVFDSNQIKLTTNLKPTTDEDIRYSRKSQKDWQGVRYSKKPIDTNIEETAEYEDTIFFMEELKRAISQGGRTSWSTSSILAETLRNTPSIDIISRLNNGEDRIGQALAHYLSSKQNIQEVEDLLYFGTMAHSQEWKFKHEIGLKRYAQIINQRLSELAKNQKTIKIEQGKCSLKEIRTIFNVYNTNEDIKKLASKVFANAELSKLNIRFGESGGQFGYNNGREVVLDISYFNDAGYTNQHKAETILHELIHATTTCALSVYEQNSSLLSNEMRQACKTLNDIYRQIKDMKAFQDEYGKVSVYEMVAELSNATFRSKLQKVNLWTKIVEAIKKFFGIRNTTALEGASTALDYILDNTRLSRVELYYRLGDAEKALQYSRKITKEMSENERYEVLKDRVIENIPTAKQLRNEDIVNIATLKGSEKKKLVKKIVSEFGIFDKQYYNADIELDFNYSKSNLHESYGKQKKNYVTFTKMFSVFDEIIDNAIGIEVHNRNDEGYKYDKTLKQVYVLASAFIDGENIVPVKLEIKEFVDKPNSLYVAVALDSIKREGVSRQEVANGVAQQYRRPSTTISIAELFRNINPNDKNFTKYIPKQFFEGKIEYSKKPIRGDLVKEKGNLTTDKIYTKDEAKAIEKKVIALIGDENTYETIARENEIIDNLWKGLNKAKENEYTGIACEIADTIIANTLVQDMRDIAEIDSAEEILQQLKPYLHSIKFSESDKQEIKYRYDKHAIKIYGRWGAKNSKGISLDQLAQDTNLQYIIGDAYSTQDILEKLDDAYQQAKDKTEKNIGKELARTLDSGEFKSLRFRMVQTILREKDKLGEKTVWKKLNDDLKTQAKVYFNGNRALYNIQRIKDMKKNGMAMELTKIFNAVGRLVYQGNIRISAIHKSMVELDKWYSLDNPQLADLGNGEVVLVEELKEKISYLAEITADTKTISSQSIKMLDEVMSKIYHIANTYKKVYQNGKWANATEQAVEYEAIDRANRKTPQVERKFFGKLLDKVRSALEYVIDPMSVMRYHDGYNKKGFWTSMFSQFREGVMNKERRQMEIQLPLDKFLAEHKGYEYDKRTIKYNGQVIPGSKKKKIIQMLESQRLTANQKYLMLAYLGYSTDMDKVTQYVHTLGLTRNEQKEIIKHCG